MVVGSGASINRYEIVENGNRRNTTVIDIEKPDSRGISYNRFEEFNISGEDLILNNTKKARIIINEIVSEIGDTLLTGILKVIGKKARLVIVNPLGVRVNGVELINSERVSLVGGRRNASEIDERYEVGGKVEIVENGIKNRRELEIIAKYVKISGEVISETIEMVTGEGIYERKEGGSVGQTSTGDKDEESSIEVKEGINVYSNRLKIIGKKVLNKGNIISSNFTRIICKSLKNEEKGIITTNEGEMIIDVDGNIDNVRGSIISTEGNGDLRIKANEIKNERSSRIKSSNGLYIETNKLFNIGEAEGNTHYTEYEGRGQSPNDKVKIVPHGKENVKVTRTAKASEILSQGEMIVDVKEIENRSSEISSRGKLKITGNTIRNERLEFNVNRLYKVNLGGKITDTRREENIIVTRRL